MNEIKGFIEIEINAGEIFSSKDFAYNIKYAFFKSVNLNLNNLFIYDCNCYGLMACIYSNECYTNMVYFNSPLEMEDFPINIIKDFY
jgi:hypothetical protein